MMLRFIHFLLGEKKLSKLVLYPNCVHFFPLSPRGHDFESSLRRLGYEDAATATAAYRDLDRQNAGESVSMIRRELIRFGRYVSD